MKKREIIKIVIIVIILFILIGAFIIYKDNKNGYVAHYYIDNYKYDIKVKGKSLNITKNYIKQCITTPCNPIKMDEYNVKTNKKYNKLIDKVFKGKHTKEITIEDKNLTNEEIKTLSSIIKRKIEINKWLSYKILDTSSYSNNYTRRGYYVEKKDNKGTLVTVSMGTQSTGGYNISIDKIIIKGKNANIYVKETIPGKDSMVTEAFTTPIAQVIFNKKPRRIKIINKEGYSIYRKISK